MSNVIFQPPKGLSWSVKKRPTWSNETQTATSGRQVRAAFFQYPIWEYEMRWEYLKGGEQSSVNTTNDLEALMGFYMARQGSFDSFLYSDPNDNAVIQEVFGTGDGSTTAFQLQRTIGSGVDIVQNLNQNGDTPFTALYKYDWQSIKNYLPNSQGGIGAGGSWVVAPGVTLTQNAGFAPDGSSSATLINYDGSDSAHLYHVYASATDASGAVLNPPASDQFTGSIWMRADTPQTVGIEDNFGGFTVCNVTTQWQRFAVTSTSNTASAQLLITSYPSNTTQFRIYAWGPQIEVGATATSYQPTYVSSFGPTLQYSVARTNLCFFSQQFASWTLNTGVAVTDNFTTAPDGSSNAAKIVYNGTGGAGGFRLASSSSASPSVNGTTYVGYVWLRCDAGSTVPLLLSLNIGGATNITVTSRWQKFLISSAIGNGAGNLQLVVSSQGGSNASFTVYAFAGQLETGNPGNLTTSYIKTPSTAAVTVTDYSLGPTCIVTFNSAPAANALLAWTGKYYYRLHFDDDNLEFDQFMYQLWQLQTVKLQSVIL